MKTILPILLLVASSLVARAAPPPPANDNFADRINIVASGSVTVSGVNAKATSEAGDPTIAGDVAYKSVWWTWTAPFNGPATITTHGSSFDTLLGIFTGNALASLASIAESDDASSLYTSSVVFNAVGGVPYAIIVAGFNGAGGKVKLNVQVSSGPCTYSITPASRSVAYTSGSSSVAVTTTTGCTWNAVSNDSWLTVTSGFSGTGSGTVSYSIDANTALTSRTGTLTVASLTHTVTQSAAPACTYSITPTAASFSASPATNSFTMSAGTGCAWTATPNASWITIQSGSSGTGNGTTTYVVATNAPSNTRTGTITVAGLTHTITQAGTVSCTYSISPTSASYSAAGGSGNITISTLTACAWTASSPVAWITFSTTNGTGNATVSYTVGANALTTTRNTTLTVAGISHTVSQAGAACTYALTPTSVSVAAGVSTGTVAVTAGTGCAWSSVANVTWLTITSGGSGSGNGSVGYSVAANPNTAIRAGTLTIGGQTFTVNQAAAACTYSIAPTAAHYSDASGTGSIAVTAGTGCAWTAVANDAFITVNSGTPGSGNGTVGYTVAANVTTTSRTGTITVAASTFTITQDGTTPCTYGITPSSASYTSTGGSSSVAVTANAGCTWSASSAASWITISTPSGSGNGTVPYTVAANASSIARNGTLTIAGNPFTVTQAGATCAYSTTPATATFTYTGGNGTVTVTATIGCTWNSSSDASWLTATSGASGTGNGSLVYAVAASTAVTNRTGRLTIAGRITTVTQTAAPCVSTISPSSASIPDLGSSGTITITESDSTCTWTAVSSASWITVSPASGTGDGSVTFIVAPTSQSSTRTGTITLAGKTFTITQAGDTTAPTVTLTAPANGSTVSNVITLTATATDNISVTRVDFYRGAGVLLGTDTATPYNVPYQTTNLANGVYTFYARAFDPANNQGFSATNSVTVSNSAVVATNAWAQRFGGSSSENGAAVAVDGSGNINVAGAFWSSSITLGGGALANAGASDIFLGEFTAAGAPVWSKRIGGTAAESPNAMALDASGNIFIGGYFSGTTDLGGGSMTSVGGVDIFVTKYSSAGTYQWSKTFGSVNNDNLYALAADQSSGHVVITGTFLGTNPINFGGTDLTGGQTYLVKLSGVDGSHVWSKNFGSMSSSQGNGVAITSGGDIVLVGQYDYALDLTTNTMSFPPPTNSLFSVRNAQGNPTIDFFIGKFSSAGAYTWGKSFGGPSADVAKGVALDSSGNVFVSGTFMQSINLGTGTMQTPSSTDTDVFLAKFTSLGINTWAKSFSGPVSEFSTGVTVDASGNVATTGTFTYTINIGGNVLTSAATGTSDIFLAKYTTAGALTWFKGFGGTSSDSSYSVVMDTTGSAVLTGAFSTSANFNGQTLTSVGAIDIFLLRTEP